MTRTSAGDSESTGEQTTPANEKLTRTELIDQVCDRTTLNRGQAAEAVTALLDVVVESLRRGLSVRLPELGTLSIRTTSEQIGVRPGTSERITIPPKKVVHFKATSTLNRALNDDHDPLAMLIFPPMAEGDADS